MPIVLIWGLPRSGKTTLQARFIQKNWFLYNHLYIIGEKILPSSGIPEDRITYLEPYEVGTFEPIPSSMFVFCDASRYLSNRDFAKIPLHVINFFSCYGHYTDSIDPLILLDSQSIDIDLKIRQRTDDLYFIRKVWKWSIARYVYHRQEVDDNTHQPIDAYILPKGIKKYLTFQFLKDIIFYRKKWYGVFDTHSDLLFDGKKVISDQIVSKIDQKKKFKTYWRIHNERKTEESKEKSNFDFAKYQFQRSAGKRYTDSASINPDDN